MKCLRYIILLLLGLNSCSGEGEITASIRNDPDGTVEQTGIEADDDSASGGRAVQSDSRTSDTIEGETGGTETGGTETGGTETGGTETGGTETGGTETGGAEDSASRDAAAPDSGNNTNNNVDSSTIDAASSDSAYDTSNPSFDSGSAGEQIIANHTACDRFAAIPTEYLNEVKKMWINIPGESHSSGYRIGLQLLSDSDSTYNAIVTESGSPEAYREDALRISRLVRRDQYSDWITGTGEADWFTNAEAIDNIKNHIQFCNNNNLQIAAIGFGWCWDMSWHNTPGGDVDPVYNVRWAGASEGGPDGDQRWGLDADDYALTNNRISLDTYLEATQQYADLCANQGFITKVIFTTGPIDKYGGENGYQRQLKHERIRNYVQADSSRVLFDYADILAWSESGTENLEQWEDGDGESHSYQMIHPDNMLDLGGSYAEDGDHIGERGALRLAKAIWWILARISGWDG